MNQQICEVCKIDSNLSKYKCPLCFIRYCSIDCFKLHKNDADKDYNCIMRKEANESQKPKEVKFEEKKHDLIIEEGDIIVPESRIKRALQSDKLKGYLSHSKLREVVKSIDGAKKKKKALWKIMKNDGDFLEFINCLLKELGYLNEDGQFEVKEEQRQQMQQQQQIPENNQQ